MNQRNKGIVLRRIVAQRLDGFFAAWIAQLGAGTAALWARVEGRVTAAPAERETAPPFRHVPMQQQPQQQPVQQQQQKKQDE